MGDGVVAVSEKIHNNKIQFTVFGDHSWSSVGFLQRLMFSAACDWQSLLPFDPIDQSQTSM